MDGVHSVEPKSCGVVQLPVLVAFAGEDRAGVATSRRAHCSRGLRGIGGEQRGMVEGLDCAHGEGLASGGALVAVPTTQHRSSVGRISLLCWRDRKSTRLNSSHVAISYAVFCLEKKKQKKTYNTEWQ